VAPYGFAVSLAPAVMAARLLAGAAVAACAAAIGLALAAERAFLTDLVGSPELVIGASFSVVGAAVVRRAALVGWLLLGVGTSAAVYAGSAAYVGYALGGDPEGSIVTPLPLLEAVGWLSMWTWLPPYVLTLTVLPHLLPDGRTLGRWWRLPVVAAMTALAVMGLQLATEPGVNDTFPVLRNPLGSTAVRGLLGPLVDRMDPLVAVLALAAVSSVAVRLARSGPTQRRQLGWVGLSTVLAVVLVLAAQWAGTPAWVLSVAVALIPTGIAVAVLRYRLYDLDRVVNRALVAALLVAGTALAYAALVGWVGGVIGATRGVTGFVAAFAVALAFHPARQSAQRLVDRVFFGRRGDPYALLSDVDRALRDAAAPRAALADAAALVRRGLRLSGIQIQVGAEVVADGALSGPELTLPMELHGERVGVARVGARPRDVALSGVDLRVLRMVVGPLSSAAYALRLSTELEESHARLVSAREEERRRLRRDLHDGLGPQLAGVVMGVDSVRAALGRGDLDRADDLARQVGERSRTAVQDVRRLVTGLRPPVLDSLGLPGAIASVVPPHGPRIDVRVDGILPPLPAAVEVAAYRIAAEAVANAVRHSGASTIEVVLIPTARALDLVVQDDGTGLPDRPMSGVGFISMRERAGELGGWCRVEARTPRGTTVAAHLPSGAT